MKKQLISAITVGLVACASTVARADLLSNGSLDSIAVGPQTLATPAGWNIVVSGGANTSDSASSETFANVLNPGGYGLFFKAFQGTSNNPVSVNLYQNVAGSAGIGYTLTGWAGAGAGYSGFTPGSGTQSTLSLLFLDSSSNILSIASLDLQANGLGQGAPTSPATGFGYHPFSVSALSPVGTTTVEASLAIVNAYPGPQGGDPAFVADYFTLVPEPSSIGLAMLGASLLIFRRRR